MGSAIEVPGGVMRIGGKLVWRVGASVAQGLRVLDLFSIRSGSRSGAWTEERRNEVWISLDVLFLRDEIFYL